MSTQAKRARESRTTQRTRFAIVPADESDEEILALRSSAEFMTYLADAERRATTGPRKTLQQIRESFGMSLAIVLELFESHLALEFTAPIASQLPH